MLVILTLIEASGNELRIRLSPRTLSVAERGRTNQHRLASHSPNRMAHTFHAEQWLPFPTDLVFAFFANPENLPRLMPAWQKARIEDATFAPPPPRPANTPRLPGIVAGAGTRMTLSFRAFPFSPIRLPWDAEITEFAWNDHFCDVQHRGPFKSWRHCHHLHPEPHTSPTDETLPGTRLTDQLEYTLPLGPLGTIANILFVRHQLRSTFRYRQQRTADLLPKFAAAIR